MDLRQALLEVRDRLRNGTIIHDPKGYYDDIQVEAAFNMNVWMDRHECGTVACIGGWCELISGIDFGDTRNGPDSGLLELFYPGKTALVFVSYGSITAEEAAQAIDNYLNHGTPMWSKVVEHRV